MLMKKNFKKILLILSAILLVVIIYLDTQIIHDGKQAKIYKKDYATLHSVAFGMFNSDIWTQKITKIVDNKIQNFDLNVNNKEQIKSYIETILNTLILEADRAVRQKNKGKRGFFDSILGSTKQMITDSILDIKTLRKRVPEFTDAVMLEIEKPENQAKAKQVIREKLQQFMQEKFVPSTDMSLFNNVLNKYHTTHSDTCNTILNQDIQQISKTMHNLMLIILFLAVCIILFILLQGRLSSLGLIILSGTTVALLFPGIMLPMLDIEAKIAKLSFTVLEQPIIFHNQMLFYQSKSISDLVQLLLDSHKVKMIFVGILLVMFSIIFPTLKLIATYLYYYSSSILGNNPIVRFFALRSTKWSMADVMVVSIFMAYLGLDGVVGNELEHLEKQSQPMNIITTNGTHLEIGFFLFLGFVLTSFVLSSLVEKSHTKDT
ncbi:MAG: hypothetical protein DSZ12_03925 [Sulfurovum sp.]|nr:MAG: hypothetical protein DSZ12_03925 [Sulfurovum sp.]